MSIGGVLAGRAYVELTTNDSKLQKGLQNAQAHLRAFADTVSGIGRELLTASAALGTPLALSLRTFASFDDEMRMVKAVTGATGQEFDALTEKAKKLGRETSFTAKQVSEGMTSLGRMGFSPDEIQNAIKPVMDLSRATGTELAQAAEIAANNMRVFGMDAGKMADAADIMTVTANGSAQTLVDLGEALKMAGPHARRAGADLKETCAMLGILANMGIKGSLAGTALGKSYKRLADPKVQAYLREFGIVTVDNTGNLRKMRDILVDIAKAMKRMPNAEQITFAESVFDARGSLGGGTLSVNTDGIDKFLEKLNQCNGVADKTSKEMDAGIGGAFRELLSAVEGVGIAIGEIIANSILPLAKNMTTLLLAMRNWIADNAVLVKILGAVAGAGAALGVTLIGIGVGAKAIAATTKMLSSGLQILKSNFIKVAGVGTRLGDVLYMLPYYIEMVNSKSKFTGTKGALEFCRALGLVGTNAEVAAAKLLLLNNADAGRAVIEGLRQGFSGLSSVIPNAISGIARWTTSINLAASSGASLSVVMTTLKRAFSATAIASAASAAGTAALKTGLAAVGVTAKGVVAVLALASLGIKKLFAAVAAHPVLAGLIAVTTALTAIVVWAGKAEKAIREMYKAGSSTAGGRRADRDQSTAENDEKRQKSDIMFERLKQLQEISQKTQLSADQIKEAERLINGLSMFGSKEWANLDKKAGKLDLVTDAAERMGKAVKKSAQNDITNNIRAAEEEMEALKQEMQNISEGNWDKVSIMDKLGGDTGENRARAAEEVKKKIEETSKRLLELRKRQKEMDAGSQAAIYGKDETENTQKNVDDYKQQAEVTAKQEENARKAVEKAEKEMADANRTRIEKEIAEIERKKKAHLEALKQMIDAEKGCRPMTEAGKEEQQKKIKELEAKLADAEKGYQDQIAKAKKKNEEDFKKEIDSMRESYQRAQDELARQAKEKAEDRELDKAFKDNPEKGIKIIDEKIAGLAKEIEKGKQAVERAIKDAEKAPRTKEGKVDPQKEKEIKKRRDELEDLQRRKTRLEGRRDMAEEEKKRKDKSEKEYLRQTQTERAERDQKRKVEEQDARIDKEMKTNPSGAIEHLKKLLAEAKAEAAKARAEVDKAEKASLDENSEGGRNISESEQKNISKLRKKESIAESFVDKFAAKLQNAQLNLAQAEQKMNTNVGGFMFDRIAGMLGANSAEERTANNTEEIKKLIAESNKNDRRKKSTTFKFT